MDMLAKKDYGLGLTLADYEARIHLYKEQIGTGYIGIGRTLNQAKEAKVVPHGEWETWVTRTTGLTVRQAQRCMQAATEIKDGSALARLEMSKALMLLGSGLEEDQREAIAEKAAEEGSTVRELREALKQAKLQIVQETGAAMEVRDALRKAEADREGLENQIRAAQDAYRKRMGEIETEAYRRGMKDRDREAEEVIRKEFQGKLDYLHGQQRAQAEKQKALEEALNEARKSSNEQWDEGFKAGMVNLQEELQKVQKEADREADGLREDLRKTQETAAQEAEELREDLRRAQKAAQEAEGLKKKQAMILAAAEDAEKRASNLEAALEALQAEKVESRESAANILHRAVLAFFADCELMPYYPADLRKEWRAIERSVDRLSEWCRQMAGALAQAADVTEAEGAIE